MSEAWGTTGRVTLETMYSGDLIEIRLDGDVVLGHYCPNDLHAWSARVWRFSPEIPSRDAAVMWVLRHTAPDVWRAERPVVYRVVRGVERFPVARWHLHYADTDDRSGYALCVPEHVDSDQTWDRAFPYALRLAQDEYARAAR